MNCRYAPNVFVKSRLVVLLAAAECRGVSKRWLLRPRSNKVSSPNSTSNNFFASPFACIRWFCFYHTASHFLRNLVFAAVKGKRCAFLLVFSSHFLRFDCFFPLTHRGPSQVSIFSWFLQAFVFQSICSFFALCFSLFSE